MRKHSIGRVPRGSEFITPFDLCLSWICADVGAVDRKSRQLSKIRQIICQREALVTGKDDENVLLPKYSSQVDVLFM